MRRTLRKSFIFLCETLLLLCASALKTELRDAPKHFNGFAFP